MPPPAAALPCIRTTVHFRVRYVFTHPGVHNGARGAEMFEFRADLAVINPRRTKAAVTTIHTRSPCGR
jgi:hypothetical protein